MYHSGPQPVWHQGLVLWRGDGFVCNQDSAHVQMKLCPLADHLHSLVPNRSHTFTGPEPGGWGPMIYQMSRNCRSCLAYAGCM